MTDRKPLGGTHPLHPEITLASLEAMLRRVARPIPGEPSRVEVRIDRLPPSWRVQTDTILRFYAYEHEPNRLVLPRRVWKTHREELKAQAQAVLARRDAFLLAEQGPSEEELAEAPFVWPWLALKVRDTGPFLMGLLDGHPLDQRLLCGPGLVYGFGPGNRWARLFHGWVRLKGRGDLELRITDAEEDSANDAGDGDHADDEDRIDLETEVRVMNGRQMKATLARRRARTASQVRDLITPASKGRP